MKISITFVFIKLNSYPAIVDDANARYYIDQSIDKPTFVRNDKNNDFNNHSSTNISQITLNSEPTDDNHAATKSYVDSLSGNDRNRRDMSTVSNDQDNEFDNIRLTNLDSITVNRHRTSDNEPSTEKY